MARLFRHQYVARFTLESTERTGTELFYQIFIFLIARDRFVPDRRLSYTNRFFDVVLIFPETQQPL